MGTAFRQETPQSLPFPRGTAVSSGEACDGGWGALEKPEGISLFLGRNRGAPRRKSHRWAMGKWGTYLSPSFEPSGVWLSVFSPLNLSPGSVGPVVSVRPVRSVGSLGCVVFVGSVGSMRSVGPVG